MVDEVDHGWLLAAAAEAVDAATLRHVETLAASGRTTVWRVTDGHQSFVLKIYLRNEANTWAREASALETAELSLAAAPRLLGACADPPLIVMSDAGGGMSLADVLLGEDAAVAAAAVGDWAGALGRLHLHGAQMATSYEKNLAQRAPQLSPRDRPIVLREAAKKLRTWAPGLGVSISGDMMTRLSQLPEAFAVQWDVLSPGDTCPDNNIAHGESMTFLDFEYAEVRHLAWDVAYLRVPWPTCWCAWRLPADVCEVALDHYRARMRPSVSYVDSPAFDHDVDLATVGWSLESAAMFLEGALSPSAARETTARRPGRRSLVQEWGELSLDLAPAFMSHVEHSVEKY